MPLRHQESNSRLLILFCEVFHSFINSKQCMSITTMFLKPILQCITGKKLSYKNNSTDSNTLEITGEIVIPRYILICCVTIFIFKQWMYDAHTKLTWYKAVVYHRVIQ